MGHAGAIITGGERAAAEKMREAARYLSSIPLMTVVHCQYP
jgi:hypothetical protein